MPQRLLIVAGLGSPPNLAYPINPSFSRKTSFNANFEAHAAARRLAHSPLDYGQARGQPCAPRLKAPWGQHAAPTRTHRPPVCLQQASLFGYGLNAGKKGRGGQATALAHGGGILIHHGTTRPSAIRPSVQGRSGCTNPPMPNRSKHRDRRGGPKRDRPRIPCCTGQLPDRGSS